jgi:hypothetical protein
MILLSMSFFRGSWVNSFHPANTKPSPFFYSHNKSNQVEMMFQRMQVPYAILDDLDCTSITLPYRLNTSEDGESRESRIDLVILLPNKRDGLKELENKLKSYTISQIMRQFLETKDMFVYMPRFSLNSSQDFTKEFKEVCKDSCLSIACYLLFVRFNLFYEMFLIKYLKLGLNNALSSETADFSKMLSNDTDSDAWISKFHQFAEFSVNEFGTKGVPMSSFSKNTPVYI